MFDTLYYGNTVGEWLGALLLIALSLLIGRFIYWICERFLKHLARKSQTRLDDIIIDMVEEPLVVIITLLGIRLSLRTLTLSQTVGAWVNNIYYFLIPLIITWLVIRLYDAIHEEYLIKLAEQTETDLDDVLLPVLRTGIKFIAIGLGIVVGLNNAGYDVYAILAGLGLGGLAFAMAAKDTVSNIFGGITIFLQQPFKVGDKIEVKGIQGRVSQIGLRSTTLLEPRSKWKIIIPNEIFINQVVQNFDSRTHDTVTERLHLALDTNPEELANALRLIKESINNHPHTVRAWVALDKVTRYSFDIHLLYYIEIWQPEEKARFSNRREKRFAVKSEIYLNILEQLLEHDIKLATHLPQSPLPLSHHQLIVANGSDPNLDANYSKASLSSRLWPF